MYKRIMIVVDDDPITPAALSEGLDVAAKYGAEVLFFHVMPNYVAPVVAGDVMPLDLVTSREHDRHVKERADKILAAAAAQAAALAVPSQGAVGTGANAAECVANAAEQWCCDLIVVGSHGRTAFQRLIHGSLAAGLLPLTSKPTLICKKRSGEPPHAGPAPGGAIGN